MSGWGNESNNTPSTDWSQETQSYTSGGGGYNNNHDRPARSGPPQNRGYGGGNTGGGDYDQPPRAPPSNYKWASSRRRYEWKDSYNEDGGIAPRDAELEKELFGEENHVNTGLNFDKYESIPTSVRGDNPPSPIDRFEDCDLHAVMKENISLARYSTPTPVQRHSIPIVTAGKDLMACAQTGSGKTAAFLVPTLSALFGRARELSNPRPMNRFDARGYRAEPLVLILAPTRELCSQTFDECRRFCYRSMLRPCAIYGGADSFPQKIELEKGCDILAATPGRLQDFIARGKVGLNRVKYLILDEADRMLDMGFERSIRDIVEQSGMSQDRQTLMYSATFPRAIRKLARDFLKPDYLFLKVGRVGGTTNLITQKVYWVEEEEKRERLKKLLLSQPPSRTLIFVETKRGADSLDQYLYDQSFPTTSIHGDRTQMEREDALIAFKNGTCPILVATAVAARGLDIRSVMHVVNYDMTNDLDEYIHRIGRTARVGNSGLATTFFNDANMPIASDLTKVLQENKQEIPEFLKDYMTTDLTFAEDMDEDNVDLPSYAKQGLRRGDFDGSQNRGGPNWFDNNNNNNNNNNGHSNQDTGGYGNQNASGYGKQNAGGYGGGGSGYGGESGGYGGGAPRGGPPSRDGDWSCPDCNASNFSRRNECFKCNAQRPEGSYDNSAGRNGGERPRREPRPDDWNCSACNAVNFSRRTECFKCNEPRGGNSGASYESPASGNNAAPSWGDQTTSWDSSAPTSGDSWGAPISSAPAPAGGNDSWGAPASSSSAPATGNDSWGAAAADSGDGSWGSSPAPAPAAQSPAPVAAPAQKAQSPAPAASSPTIQDISKGVENMAVKPQAENGSSGDGWGSSNNSHTGGGWDPTNTPW
ncbi:hypothetical protein INT43_002644 [Umbelopsis isabellina]|uniref:ATP-dependent RNA helicase DED1 n=1 Tax=Mortierella isabellina TaxID=91625 RepID=A0A8H7Q5J4_MORIS|nr:hypothetical protein INT43_002644 [Umbelopsis isabellina]